MHGNLRKIDHTTAFAWHTLRKSPRGMPCWSLFAVDHAEASVNHAAAESANGISYGKLREPCQQKTFLRSVSRKLPKTMPQRSAVAAHLTEASEKHGANGHSCGISHGRLRTMNREEGNLRHNTRKVPSNGAPQRQSAARRTEGSEKRAKEESRNGISYGSFRKTSRKQSAKQRFQASIGAEYGG